MTTLNATALCQARDLPASTDGQAPEWVHLLPTGTVQTVDGRGPYVAADLAALARDSLQAAGGRLPIDENHATDLAAPKGLPAPARGWIVELQTRADGLWGRVEWTGDGRKLVEGRAYRGISPVIMHRGDGSIVTIKRASLVNAPNLRGLTTLHSEETMDLIAKLRKALGLADDADEAAIVAAIEKLKKPAGDALQSALQAQLAPIARAAGLADAADQAAVLTAIAALNGNSNDVVRALQSELTTVTTQLNSLQSSMATERAAAFVDNAIKSGRVGVKPMRDRYIAMHAADAAGTEQLINAMPILGPSGAMATPPAAADGTVALNSEQLAVAKMLGIDPEAYRKTLAAEQAES